MDVAKLDEIHIVAFPATPNDILKYPLSMKGVIYSSYFLSENDLRLCILHHGLVNIHFKI